MDVNAMLAVMLSTQSYCYSAKGKVKGRFTFGKNTIEVSPKDYQKALLISTLIQRLEKDMLSKDQLSNITRILVFNEDILK